MFHLAFSVILILLRELKDKYVILSDDGSPMTVAKTPYNVLKYELMEGKPIHTKSVDGYSIDQVREVEGDKTLVITSPEGTAVPLLAGKFELALNLLLEKPIAEIWRKNYDAILKNLNPATDST